MDENSPDKKASSLQINRAEHDRRIAEKLRRELGPQVCALLDDTKVIEIMLNPDGSLWCEWLGQPMERVGTMPKAQAESLMGTVASSLRTHITAANPILECELPLDGSRFEALLPPIVSGPTFTIRKKASIVFTLANYVKSGIMTETQCEAIKWAVRERKNILVVGGTGTGKTTLTNAIIAEIDAVTPEHRIVIIEDTRELQCSSRGLGSNGTKNQRKPYQRFSVSSSQAPISTKQLRMSASWLISVSRSCTLLSSSSSLRYGMVNS